MSHLQTYRAQLSRSFRVSAAQDAHSKGTHSLRREPINSHARFLDSGKHALPLVGGRDPRHANSTGGKQKLELGRALQKPVPRIGTIEG